MIVMSVFMRFHTREPATSPERAFRYAHACLIINYAAYNVLRSNNWFFVDDGAMLFVIAWNVAGHLAHIAALFTVRGKGWSGSYDGRDKLSLTDACCLFNVAQCPLIRFVSCLV